MLPRRSEQVEGVAWKVKVRLEWWRWSHRGEFPLLSWSHDVQTHNRTLGLFWVHGTETGNQAVTNPSVNLTYYTISVFFSSFFLLITYFQLSNSEMTHILRAFSLSFCLSGTSGNIFGLWNVSVEALYKLFTWGTNHCSGDVMKTVAQLKQLWDKSKQKGSRPWTAGPRTNKLNDNLVGLFSVCNSW